MPLQCPQRAGRERGSRPGFGCLEHFQPVAMMKGTITSVMVLRSFITT